MAPAPAAHPLAADASRRWALRVLGQLVVGGAAAAAGDAGLAVAAPARDATAPPELLLVLPQARLNGSSRFRYFGFHVYDAQLWVSPVFEAARPFAHTFGLSLVYARSLKARDIAERSIEEMRRQAPIGDAEAQRWAVAMTAAFADVRSGDRLTGLHTPGSGASFFYNGQATQTIADARFSGLFFGIWLSPATSAPGLRRELLGA